MIGALGFNKCVCMCLCVYVCLCICVCVLAVLQWFPMVAEKRNKNQLEGCLRILLIKFS